jgi:gas vesicle protein
MMSTMLLLLAVLLVAPSNVSSFQSMSHVSLQGSPVKAVSTQQRVPQTPLFYMFEGMLEGKDDHAVKEINIRDVTDEAEEALKAAAKALDVSPAAAAAPTAPATPPPTKKKAVTAKATTHPKPPTFPFFAIKDTGDKPSAAAKSVGVSATIPAPPSTPVMLPAPTGEALASAFGGAALGAVAASAITAQIPELSDSLLAYIPPLVSAAALGGAAYSGASEESKIGEMTRKILGKTVIGLGRGIVAAIKSVAGRIAAEIAAVPGKIVSAIQKHVKKTTDKIKAIPSNFQAAAQKQTEAFATEIKATPGRVAESTKQAVNKSVDNTKQQVAATVKEVHAYPSKKYTEIENNIAAFLGNGELKTPAPPQPPKLPPPPMAQSAPLTKLSEIKFSVKLPSLANYDVA